MVTDLVGTPRELIGEQGEIAWRTRTTLWGATSWNAGAITCTPLRLPGQYFDPETCLHYNYFRHYDPETARYLSADPLGLAPAPNAATYVATPSTSYDPLGLAPDDYLRNKPVGRGLEGAKQDALRDAGIPEGNPPLEVRTHVPATTPEWQGGKQSLDENHQPIYYREEVYEHPNGNDLIVYQDHWFGHQEPGEPGYQPAHVRVRPFENTRNGQVPGARNIITMTARLSPRNSEVLAPLYGPAPLDLSSVRLRSVHLDWHGPTVTLRLDLPTPPLPLPEEWAAAGVDTVQGQLQFLAVEDLELDAWEPGPLVSFELAVLSESRHRIRVAVSHGGKPDFLRFTGSADVLVGRISGFRVGPEGADGGPHHFCSRLDGRLHTTVPDPSEKTFYERL